MPIENYRYGGGASETLLHPVVLVALLLTLALLWVLPRRYAVFPVVSLIILFPLAQQIYVGGVHLFVARIAILMGLLRSAATSAGPGEKWLGGGTNGIDKAFILCILAEAIAVMLLFHDGAAVINQVGFIWDWLGGYLLLRSFIREEQDVYAVLKIVAIVTIPIAALMIVEQMKMYNVFSDLGGVPVAPEVREGKIRSQGPFAHSLMAGTFGAMLVPLFILLWKSGKSTLFGIIGLVGSLTMAITTNSSTPLLAFAGTVVGFAMWPLRKKMKRVRWGIVLSLIGLQLVMKAPVWFLIARIDLTGGSSSYHRADLVDQFINHFSNWWLIGTNDNADWGLDMFDVQNQFVNVGQTGGLLAFIAFILVFVRSYARLGNARKIIDGNKDREWMLWIVGVTLFSLTVGFFGVNFFDQSRIGFFLLLAIICAVTRRILETKEALSPASADTVENSENVPARPSRFRLKRKKKPVKEVVETKVHSSPLPKFATRLSEAPSQS